MDTIANWWRYIIVQLVSMLLLLLDLTDGVSSMKFFKFIA